MCIYAESETMELKAKFTDTICRDIVAFLNTNGGDIVIGVDDEGKIIGVEKLDETSRRISDMITDQIEPNPQSIIHSEIRYEEGMALLILHIQKGVRPVYCQKKYGFSSSGCLVRIGTTCRNMTSEQIRMRYEKNFTESDLMINAPAKYQSISFKTLKIYYSERGYHLGDSSFEENLSLRMPDGRYNLLAELLSDNNMIPLIFVKFRGLDKSSVSERNDYGSRCLLFGYEQIKNRLMAENVCVSDTTVRPRNDRYLFDFDCANEAVINALVHNDWNISQPLISMFHDRIEVLSHGGLPKGQTREQFFKGISRPRNDMLMRIFLNMELTEHTGHGVPTILSKYGESAFDIGDSYINVVIPFDKDVLDATEEDNNGGKNGGLGDGLTDDGGKNGGLDGGLAENDGKNGGISDGLDGGLGEDGGINDGINGGINGGLAENDGKNGGISGGLSEDGGINGGINGGLSEDGGISGGINGGLSETEKAIIRCLSRDPLLTVANLAEKIGVSKRTAERGMKRLQENGFIAREGARKNGSWVVLRRF